MKYRPEIDGLRAVAVIPVILFHAGFEAFGGGFVGVDVFFVISGYLITTILLDNLQKGTFSILEFYERRARRILPALFFVMACTLPFAWFWMLPGQMLEFSRSVVATTFFVSNVLFWRESGYFATAAEEKPLLHTWSLAVEEQYYLLFPVFLFFAWRFGRSAVFWAIVLLAVISLALSEWGWRNTPSANFYLAPTRAWELFAGSIAAFVVRGQGVRANDTLALAGLAAILIAIFFYDENVPFPSVYALLPVSGVVLLILFGDRTTLVARLLSLRLFVGIGLISYSAYLWHQPIFALARIRLIGEPDTALMIGLSALSLGLAVFSWKYVEQPFRVSGALKIQRRSTIFVASVAGICAFALLGAAGVLSRGVPDRLPAPVLRQIEEIGQEARKRQTAIRAGECQFNERGKHASLAAFLEHWNCLPQDGASPKVAVFGDSHAADIAVALRSARYGVAQLTGAACPLVTGGDVPYPRYCNRLLDRFLQELPRSEYDYLVLANRFEGDELQTAYLQKIVDFWGPRHDRILVFTPMPEFPRFAQVYSRFGKEAASLPYEKTVLERFQSAAAEVWLPGNVAWIDSRDLLCQATSGSCAPIHEGRLMMTDSEHLTVFGAERFGQELDSILAGQE